MTRFNEEFGARDLEEIASDGILSFLTRNTSHTKQNTKRSRYACLKSLFKFIIESVVLKIGLYWVFRVTEIVIRTGAGLLVVLGKNIDGWVMGNRSRLAL